MGDVAQQTFAIPNKLSRVHDVVNPLAKREIGHAFAQSVGSAAFGLGDWSAGAERWPAVEAPNVAVWARVAAIGAGIASVYLAAIRMGADEAVH